MRAEFGAQPAGEQLQAALRRPVGRDARPGDLAHQRADVDDLPGAAAYHTGRDGTGEQERAGEVRGQDPVPHLGCHGEDALAVLDAGVVDQDVEAAGRLRLGYPGSHRRRVGDVEGDRRHPGLRAGLGDDMRAGRVNGRAVSAVYHDRAARPRQADRQRQTDPPAGAGDQRPPATHVEQVRYRHAGASSPVTSGCGG